VAHGLVGEAHGREVARGSVVGARAITPNLVTPGSVGQCLAGPGDGPTDPSPLVMNSSTIYVEIIGEENMCGR
jgi:hypothetical protein